MHVKRGNIVKILVGKEKGKTGKIVRVFTKMNKVVVEGINLSKKHKKSNKSDQKGQIIDKAMPIHVSNVSLLKKPLKKAKKSAQVRN